ncbi:MAG: ABC transporter permease, partial [Gemmatimonadetes bacterium]|nr:ABC transporter permease [Gemmatimonadota bacterium]
MDLRETASLSLIGLLSHKLRTLLTMLGIIFGVAAVIAMLSIGEGAKQESLEQIRQMGISNIIVQHWEKEADEETEGSDSDQNRSPGLTWDDARSIARICLLADYVTPQREVKVKAQAQDHTFRTMVVGTTPDYLTVLDARMGSGVFFSVLDLNTAKRVCVWGADAKREPFFFDNP